MGRKNDRKRESQMRVKKGLEWSNNSCYADSTLFSMFYRTRVFDELFLSPTQHCDEVTKRMAIFRKIAKIIELLRSPDGFCPLNYVQELRNLLAYHNPRTRRCMMDIDEFVQTLFEFALDLPPFIHYTNENTNFLHQIILFKNQIDRDIMDVQSCLRLSMENQELTFAAIPQPALLIKMPRSNGVLLCMDSLIPNSILDISDFVMDETADGRATMELHAVICLRARHYTTFVRCGNRKESAWAYFNSLGPSVTEPIQGLTETMDTICEQSRSGSSINFGALSHDVHRIISDIHACIYIPQRKNPAHVQSVPPLYHQNSSSDLTMTTQTKKRPKMEDGFVNQQRHENRPPSPAAEGAAISHLSNMAAASNENDETKTESLDSTKSQSALDQWPHDGARGPDYIPIEVPSGDNVDSWTRPNYIMGSINDNGEGRQRGRVEVGIDVAHFDTPEFPNLPKMDCRNDHRNLGEQNGPIPPDTHHGRHFVQLNIGSDDEYTDQPSTVSISQRPRHGVESFLSDTASGEVTTRVAALTRSVVPPETIFTKRGNMAAVFPPNHFPQVHTTGRNGVTNEPPSWSQRKEAVNKESESEGLSRTYKLRGRPLALNVAQTIVRLLFTETNRFDKMLLLTPGGRVQGGSLGHAGVTLRDTIFVPGEKFFKTFENNDVIHQMQPFLERLVQELWKTCKVDELQFAALHEILIELFCRLQLPEFIEPYRKSPSFVYNVTCRGRPDDDKKILNLTDIISNSTADRGNYLRLMAMPKSPIFLRMPMEVIESQKMMGCEGIIPNLSIKVFIQDTKKAETFTLHAVICRSARGFEVYIQHQLPCSGTKRFRWTKFGPGIMEVQTYESACQERPSKILQTFETTLNRNDEKMLYLTDLATTHYMSVYYPPEQPRSTYWEASQLVLQLNDPRLKTYGGNVGYMRHALFSLLRQCPNAKVQEVIMKEMDEKPRAHRILFLEVGEYLAKQKYFESGAWVDKFEEKMSKISSRQGEGQFSVRARELEKFLEGGLNIKPFSVLSDRIITTEAASIKKFVHQIRISESAHTGTLTIPSLLRESLGSRNFDKIPSPALVIDVLRPLTSLSIIIRPCPILDLTSMLVSSGDTSAAREYHSNGMSGHTCANHMELAAIVCNKRGLTQQNLNDEYFSIVRDFEDPLGHESDWIIQCDTMEIKIPLLSQRMKDDEPPRSMTSASKMPLKYNKLCEDAYSIVCGQGTLFVYISKAANIQTIKNVPVQRPNLPQLHRTDPSPMSHHPASIAPKPTSTGDGSGVPLMEPVTVGAAIREPPTILDKSTAINLIRLSVIGFCGEGENLKKLILSRPSPDNRVQETFRNIFSNQITNLCPNNHNDRWVESQELHLLYNLMMETDNSFQKIEDIRGIILTMLDKCLGLHSLIEYDQGWSNLIFQTMADPRLNCYSRQRCVSMQRLCEETLTVQNWNIKTMSSPIFIARVPVEKRNLDGVAGVIPSPKLYLGDDKGKGSNQLELELRSFFVTENECSVYLRCRVGDRWHHVARGRSAQLDGLTKLLQENQHHETMEGLMKKQGQRIGGPMVDLATLARNHYISIYEKREDNSTSYPMKRKKKFCCRC